MKVVPSRPEVRTDPAPLRGPASAMIEIDHVSQTFRTSGRQAHLALSDISLTIEDGAFVSILGPSGCGKSTLLCGPADHTAFDDIGMLQQHAFNLRRIDVLAAGNDQASATSPRCW